MPSPWLRVFDDSHRALSAKIYSTLSIVYTYIFVLPPSIIIDRIGFIRFYDEVFN